MSLLYSTLAGIYHEMYQHIFDYDEEFSFYDTILKANNCRKILEIGCGSGMLARRFLKQEYDYLGVDISENMLDIARLETNSERFHQSDMRNLSLNQEFDAVLITGRSIAYVIENRGIISTLEGVYKLLKDKGLFVFGVFEAKGIFNDLNDFKQDISHNNKRFQRISKLSPNLATGWTWDWDAHYIIEDAETITELHDLTTLRSFTKDEISLFTERAGFEIKRIIEEKKALTLIAEKR
jgi:SAM-dependent methyltransferase